VPYPFIQQISVTTAPESEEAVAALLEGLFGERPSVHSDPRTRKFTVSVYLTRFPCRRAEAHARLQAGLKRIRGCGLRTGVARVAFRRVRSEDWAESWKKHFKPLEIGRALLIRPTWSHRRPRSNQAVVVLDPGLSFGTGQHPTTIFCLEQLVTRRRPAEPQSFLDIGTGSGILAIAAAKLGYHPVHAFDHDPTAIRVANANALQNHAEGLIRFNHKDLSRMPAHAHRKFHLICANLVCDLLIEQSKRILSFLEPNGILVLAGTVVDQFPEVASVYKAGGLKLLEIRTTKEWRSAAFTPR